MTLTDVKQDMSLTVDVTLTGEIDSSGNLTISNVAYAQGATNPTSPNVVDGQGDIDLTQMQKTSGFSKDTGITFVLAGTITDSNGNNVPFSFPSEADQAITIDHGSGDNGSFSASFGSNVCTLIVNDLDKDAKHHDYCLNIWANWGNGIDQPIDPAIINR